MAIAGSNPLGFPAEAGVSLAEQLSRPAFRRQAGQCPWGDLAESEAPHCGQTRATAMVVLRMKWAFTPTDAFFLPSNTFQGLWGQDGKKLG